MYIGSEAGSYLRLIDPCITQREAQGPSRTCDESKEYSESSEWCPAIIGPRKRGATVPWANAITRRVAPANQYGDTSPISNRAHQGPYSRNMPRAM